MKTLHITLFAAALTLAFSASSSAQSMSKTEHKAAEEKIEAQYKSAKTGAARLRAMPRMFAWLRPRVKSPSRRLS